MSVQVRPGINILSRSTPPPRTLPTDTGVWFVVGLADAGPIAPTLLRNIADYERLFGLRVSYSVLYDALDVFFREGGSNVYVSRVVGPAATSATKNLLTAATVSLTATALGPGAFYNNIKIGVRAGVGSGTFVVFIQDANNVEVETSPDLDDQNAAVTWSQSSNYVRLTLGVGTSDPDVVAAGVMAGGADDRNNIVDLQWQQALDRFTKDLGVGQVSAPGRVTTVGHTQLLAHAGTNFRTAILDATDTPTIATLQAESIASRAGNQRYGGTFWPWLIVPGFVTGTTRTVPPCAAVCGRIAANDAVNLGANSPSAGDNGQFNTVVNLSQADKTDTERTTLNTSSVNVIRRMFNGIRIYGWRTLVNPVSDPYWVDLGNVRLYMAIAGEAQAIAERYIFRQIDGQGRIFNDFKASLIAMLQGYYASGDLYGATSDDAYKVDTTTVNTPATIANRELHALISVRMSEFAEMVLIEIYKQAITEP
jgi:hypothetical protein